MLICSFRGWNDGGQGASLAGAYLARAWRAEQFAEIDPEGFFDFQMTRPQVALENGERRIEWPENTFHYVRLTDEKTDARRDAVLLLGTEPGLRWKTFTALVSGFATELGTSLVVTLGSLLADVPHTRPAPVTASATDPAAPRGARPAAVALRGADGRRRRPPRRLPRREHPLRLALGRGPALRAADTLAARGKGALRPARHAARGAARHLRARRGEPTPTCSR